MEALVIVWALAIILSVPVHMVVRVRAGASAPRQWSCAAAGAGVMCLLNGLLLGVAGAAATEVMLSPSGGARGSQTELFLSVALLTAPVAILISIAVGFFRARLVARTRVDAGACRGCGYDLEGNVTGVCPECGSLAPRGETDRSIV